MGIAVMLVVPEGWRGVCCLEALDGVFKGEPFGWGDLPFIGERDEFCEERKPLPSACFNGVAGAKVWPAFGLAGERAGDDRLFTDALSERVESCRTRLRSATDSGPAAPSSFAGGEGLFPLTPFTSGAAGEVCARITTGEAVPEPGRR